MSNPVTDHGNIISATPVTKSEMDDWEAFDLLPPRLRRAVTEMTFDGAAADVLAGLELMRRIARNESIAQIKTLLIIEQNEARELALWDEYHVDAFGVHCPHVAAGVSFQRYEARRGALRG
jgi:hypothetical protein